LRPPISLQDTETRWDKNSSQADSAGSIPVTRSTHEKRCSTSEFDRILQAGQRSFTPETALVPLRVPLAILASAPGRLSVHKLTVRLQFPGTPLLRLAGRDDRRSGRVGRRAPAVGRRGDPLTVGRCPGPSAQRTVAVTPSRYGTTKVMSCHVGTTSARARRQFLLRLPSLRLGPSYERHPPSVSLVCMLPISAPTMPARRVGAAIAAAHPELPASP
jgi:hypothetical protein